jgi:dTDP-4-dehydrorhamnose 3,5-epimerase
MGSVSVDDILITQLKRIQVAGGDVLHGMKCSDSGYVDFGEAYCSIVEANAIKAWKRHLRMTLNIFVPFGIIKCIFLDELGGARKEEIGENRYVRLTVPPGIWFGFEGKFSPFSMLINIADIPHHPTEVERKALDELNFDWKRN